MHCSIQNWTGPGVTRSCPLNILKQSHTLALTIVIMLLQLALKRASPLINRVVLSFLILRVQEDVADGLAAQPRRLQDLHAVAILSNSEARPLTRACYFSLHHEMKTTLPWRSEV
jgi:hypothetical protein